MSLKPTKEVCNPKDIHKLPKTPSAASKPPANLRQGRGNSVDDHSEMIESTRETSYAEQRSQTTPVRPAPAKLRRSTAMNFDRPTIAAQIASLALEDKLSPTKDGIASSQAPFDQPDVSQVGSCSRFNSVKSSQSRESGSSLKTNSRHYDNLQTNGELQHGDAPTYVTSFMQQPFPYKPAKQTRYYSWALSKEEKQALTAGEKKNNLKDWDAKELVRFHESRLELVPRDQEDRDAVLAEIQKDKENAEWYLMRTGKRDSRTAQSTPELHVSSAPEPLAFLVPIPPPQISPSLPIFPSELREPPHTCNVSTGDYFSRPLARRSGRPLSQPSSRHHSHASHVRSPLFNQLVFEPRSDVTFDSFLEPHTSGKGEAYRGAENAKKDDQPGEEEDSIELRPMGLLTKNLSGRLSKMPSMPSLCVRKMRGEFDSPMGE